MNKRKIIKIILILWVLLTAFLVGIVIVLRVQRNNSVRQKEREREELIKNAKIEVKLIDNTNIPFAKEIKISEMIESINGEIVDDRLINTSSLGVKTVEFEFINDEKIKVPYRFNVNIFDDIPPLIWMGSTLSIEKGDQEKLEDKIMCADNDTSKPHCFVEGEYDTNIVGKYNLVMKAVDNSGNEASKEFVLNVYEPKQNEYKSTSRDTITNYSDIVRNYKNDKTSIGIDVSGWQGEIDYQKVKDAGVEFAFIKVGGEKGIDGEYYVDSKFIRNIEGFNSVDIPVGVYVFSYAKNKEQAKNEALWIIDQIKNYRVDLPIVFDWENWGSFNEFGMSLFELSDAAGEFVRVANDNGYQGATYGSKNYLEKVWLKVPGIIWLAHYNSETSYQEHTFWQICDDGVVEGINGKVDIDIWYKE